MKKERTEEDKLCKAPIEVVLGGEKYQISLLPTAQSRPWRGKVAESLAQLPRRLSGVGDEPDVLEQQLQGLLVTSPDLVIDLFFEYAKDLDREAIEAVANDYEIAAAFEEVIAVAFPLTRSLIGVVNKATS